jgi:eukaryotic-like serine/threonine-protein kinase
MAPSESFTSASLEAIQSFSLGQDLLYAGKYEDAIKQYKRAIEHDASIGRAYAGLATALYATGQRDEAERQWKKALSLMDRMTEREKYRTQAIYYARISGNYEKAIEIYSTLVEKYPSDWAAHGNLGGVYFLVLNFPKALEETRKAVKLAPRNILYRNNSILMAMYAGEFDTAVKEADAYIKEEPGFFKNYLPLAVAAISEGRFDAAVDAYERMAKTGSSGASLAAMGLGDLAMYRGRYAEAETILKNGIAEDRKAKNTAGLAAKLTALAETYAATGRMPLALRSAEEALALGRQEVAVLVPAARLYVQAHKATEAADLAAELDNKLQTQPRAYAKIIDGNIALLNRRRASALDAFRDAIKLADFWMARFDQGVTYVQAEHHAEGLAELELCQKRRGEATAIFLDEEPTFRYLATLPYWLGRAQEGVGQQAAAVSNYKAFLSLRPESPTDPLVLDALKRTGS